MDYLQRNYVELSAAQKVAQAFKVQEHKILRLDLSQFGGFSTDGRDIPVPDYSGNLQIPLIMFPLATRSFFHCARMGRSSKSLRYFCESVPSIIRAIPIVAPLTSLPINIWRI